MTSDQEQWFGVRCFIRWEDEGSYEERITIWTAPDIQTAIALAEEEARAYCSGDHGRRMTLVEGAQAYWLTGPPEHGSEVFSLLRDSDLPPDEYVDRFFMTGQERES